MQSTKHIGAPGSWGVPALGVLAFVACIGFTFVPLSISYAGWMVELPQKDRQVVQNLLRTAQFSRLNQLYDALQQQYETGVINDRDLSLQYQAFYDPLPE